MTRLGCIFVLSILAFGAFPVRGASVEIKNELKQPRILSGTPVSIYETRYIASVRVKSIEAQKGYGHGHVCTGAVITQRVVLTAAVCHFNQTAFTRQLIHTSDLTVVLGSTYLYQKDTYALQYDVQSFLPHPNFNYTPSTLSYDIALMFLSGYIPWNYPTVAAVPLNTKAVQYSTECQVTGWGQPPSNIPKVKGLLVQVQVPIVNTTRCQDDLTFVSMGTFCAGYRNFSGVSACGADAGAPLTCNGLLTGNANWDNGCLDLANFGDYTNTTYFQDWIVQTNATLNYSHYGNGSERLGISKIWATLTIIFNFMLCVLLK